MPVQVVVQTRMMQMATWEAKELPLPLRYEDVVQLLALVWYLYVSHSRGDLCFSLLLGVICAIHCRKVQEARENHRTPLVSSGADLF